jgi:hypothetical protein
LKENFDRFNSQIYKEKEMADFRRCILAFAVVALLCGLLPTANAQTVNGLICTANAAVPPTLRAEGLTELVGDIVLTCTGGTSTPAGTTVPQANFQVFLNTQVTSRLFSGSLSEAIMTIDEPTAAQVVACTGTCGAIGAGPGAPNQTEFKNGSNSNVFQGTVAGNSVIFTGIPVDPPGTTGQRIFRITNVRANANAVSAPGANGIPGQIIGLISATPATGPGGLTSSFSINNPQVVVGFVQSSLTTSITGTISGKSPAIASDIGILQCVGKGVGTSVGVLNYTELFPTAFKTHTVAGSSITAQNTLGLVYNSESGYYNPALPSGYCPSATSNCTGLADMGTRLRAVFNNVPNGVSIFVSVNNLNSSGTSSPVSGTFAQLVSSEGTVDGATGFTPVSATSSTGGGIWQVPITNGSGEAVWEVVAANPLALQTYSFAYYATATASPSTNSPAIGTATVNMWYAPTAPTFAASAGGTAQNASVPIPRFVDASTATNAIAVTICRTNLLYPYVTSQAGFDTGLAISNTSTDPFGTAAQAGPCTLYFYGTNAPASYTTPSSVASGTTWSNLATTLAPNFTGYVIALCNFQYAHGFAFISDVGARNLAMGYLALVIPDPAQGNRQAAPFECGQGGGVAGACDNGGEELGN